MFISRIFIDGRKHRTAQAMYNRGIFHGAIEQCFCGKRQKSVWRLDHSGQKLCLMIISQAKPDLTSITAQFGVEGLEAEIKPYDDYIASIHDGEILHFRLSANPTIKKDSKRIPLNKEKTDNQSYCAFDWLIDRMKKNGAEVLSAQISMYESYKITYGGKRITLVEAVYDGSIRVMDHELLSEALKNGIGHGKAYGCGLLTVMR